MVGMEKLYVSKDPNYVVNIGSINRSSKAMLTSLFPSVFLTCFPLVVLRVTTPSLTLRGCEHWYQNAYLFVVDYDLEFIGGLRVRFVDDFCGHCSRKGLGMRDEFSVMKGLRWFVDEDGLARLKYGTCYR